MEGAQTETAVYCGVTIINAVLGGLNVLLITWLTRARKNADQSRMDQHRSVMRRLDSVEDGIVCPYLKRDTDP